MFMKIAYIEDPKAPLVLKKCCELNNVKYVPLQNNYFGLSTNLFSMEYGREDANNPTATNLKSFVNTFIDAEKAGFPYKGIIFNNMFFIDVLNHCHAFNIPIEIEGVKVVSQYGTEDTLTDEEDIVCFIKDIRQHAKDIIKKLYLNFKDTSIIISNNGYVDIGARETFCRENQAMLINMIKAGLEE